MGIEALSGYWPLLSVAMLLGLILSACLRRHPWAPLVWVPTTGAYAMVSILIGLRVLWLRSMRGPDAGWGGMELMFLMLPALAACLIGLVLCRVFRPRGGWNPKAVVAAVALTAGALGVMVWNSASNVELTVLDTQGRAVPDFSYSINSAPLVRGSGPVQFKLRRGRGAYVQLFTVSPSNPAEVGSGCSVGLRFPENDRGVIEVRHSWSRFRIAEAFLELIPAKRNIALSVTLPPQDSLVPAPDRARLRKAFDSVKPDPGREGAGYEYVCRNLGAVEFMPELIAAYGGSRSQQLNVTGGLKGIAATLNDLDRHCREIRKELGNGPNARAKVAPLCEWAKVPFDEKSDPNKALDQVEAEIARQAAPLIDFCLLDGPGDKRPPWILDELGMINRPRVREFVAMLLKKPPADMQDALGWSGVFFGTKVRKSDVRELVDSPDPLLQTAVQDVRED